MLWLAPMAIELLAFAAVFAGAAPHRTLATCAGGRHVVDVVVRMREIRVGIVSGQLRFLSEDLWRGGADSHRHAVDLPELGVDPVWCVVCVVDVGVSLSTQRAAPAAWS